MVTRTLSLDAAKRYQRFGRPESTPPAPDAER